MLVVYKTEAPEPELKQLAINSDRCMHIHILFMHTMLPHETQFTQRWIKMT